MFNITSFFFSFFLFFLREREREREFQLMMFTPNDSSLSSDQTPISFWCRQEMNPGFLIQPSETLPVELTATHKYN